MGTEVRAEAPIADATWRPEKVGDTWICRRYHRIPGASGLNVETFGARLNGPNGDRFSPLHLFEEARAQEQCDRLNGGDND